MENEIKISGIGKRAAAFLIDHFLICFLLVLGFFTSDIFSLELNESLKPTFFLLAFVVVSIPYICRDICHGISPGKWIMGIMIRDEYDSQKTPSFPKLCFRNVFLFIWPIEFIVLCATFKKQKIGDLIAKTIVVHNPQKTKSSYRFSAAIAIVALIFLTGAFAGSITVKKTNAYQIAEKTVSQNQEIISETGGIKGFGVLPTANINIVNGHGSALFVIKVKGEKKNEKVSVRLKKAPESDWELIEIKSLHR